MTRDEVLKALETQLAKEEKFVSPRETALAILRLAEDDGISIDQAATAAGMEDVSTLAISLGDIDLERIDDDPEEATIVDEVRERGIENYSPQELADLNEVATENQALAEELFRQNREQGREEVERSLFNGQILTEDQRQEMLNEYSNLAPLGSGVSSYDDFIVALQSGDYAAQVVMGASVTGTQSAFTQMTIGVNGLSLDQAMVPNAQLDHLRNTFNITSDQQLAMAVYGVERLGLDYTVTGAISNYLDSFDPRESDVQKSKLDREIRDLTEQMNAATMQDEKISLGRRIQALKEQSASVGSELLSEQTRNYVYQDQHRQAFFDYKENLEQFGGSVELAFVATFDPELASRFFEDGGAASAEDVRAAIAIFDDAGIRTPDSDRGIPGEENGAAGWLAGMSNEGWGLLTGSQLNGGGASGQTVSFQTPDESTLEESYLNMYRSWFGAEPNQEQMSSFVASIKGQVRAEAMKQVQDQTTTYNPWKNGGVQEPIVIEGSTVDAGSQLTQTLRNDPLYDEMFGKKGEGVSESQYVQQFSNQAQSMLGAEGIGARELVGAGQRTGDVNTTSRMSVYDKRYRDNSTLMGRMANAASTVARYT